MERVYEVLSCIFTKDIFKESVRFQKVLICLLSIQSLAQNINFLWNPYLTIDNWKKYESFWVFINYPCIDSIFANLDLLFPFLVFTCSLLLLSTLLILIIVVLVLKGKNVPYIIIKALRFCLKFTCEMYFIPSTIILVLLFKYSGWKFNNVQEYAFILDPASMEHGTNGKVIAVIFLFLHLIFSLIYESCKIDIRHSADHVNIMASSGPNLEIFMKIVNFAQSIVFTNLQITYYLETIVSFTVLYGFCTYKYIYYLPFYSKMMNYARVLMYFEAFSISVFFIVATYLKNATIVLVLTIFMQPFIIFFVLYLCEYRFSKIRKIRKEVSSNLVVFELAARKNFRSPTKTKQFVKIINLHYSKVKNKLVLVYLANYFNNVLRNRLVASIKVAQADWKGLNLSTNFQIYQSQKYFQKCNFKDSQGLRLCIFLLKYDIILQKENIFAENLIMTINQLFNSNFSVANLKLSIKTLFESLSELRKQYEEVLKEYPETIFLSRMFGSLLIDYYNEIDLGQMLILKCRMSIDKFDLSNSLDFFSEFNSMKIIVSGTQKTFGKLVYANITLCEYLNITLDNYKSYSFSEFIPNPIKQVYDFNLRRFIESTQTHLMFTNSTFFLCDYQGFLLEASYSCECIGYKSEIYFVGTLKPFESNLYEFALLSPKGDIYAHSAGFLLNLGSRLYKAEGKNLADFINNYYAILIENGKCIAEYYSLECGINIVCALVLTEEFILDKSIQIVYCFVDSEEIQGIYEALLNSFDYKLPRTIADDYGRQKLEKKYLFITKKIKEESNEVVSIMRLESEKNNYDKSTRYSQIKMIKSLPSSISYSKRLLVCIRIFILAVIGIISLLILLAWFYIEYKLDDSLGSFKMLNYHNKLLVLMSTTIQALYVTENFNYTNEGITSDLLNLISELDGFLADPFIEYDFILHCKSSSILHQNLINVIDQNFNITKCNLFDLTKDTSNHAKKIYELFKGNRKNYEQNYKFIYYNTLRVSMEDFQNFVLEIEQCEAERLEKLNMTSIIFFIVFSLVLMIGLFSLMVLIFRLKIQLNYIWKLLLKSVNDQYNSLVTLISERLILFDQEIVSKDTDMQRDRVKLKYRHAFLYFSRISIIIIALTIIYFIIYLYFYKEIKESITESYMLIKALSLQFTRISYIYFFGLDQIKYLRIPKNTSFELYPVTQFNSSLENFSTVLTQYKITNHFISKTSSKIFSSFSNQTNLLIGGILPAYSEFMENANYIVNTESIDNAVLIKMYKDYITIAMALNETTINFIQNQIDKISTLFDQLIAFVGVSVIALIILTMGVNFIFIQHESKTIDYINQFLMIIPGENLIKNKRKKNT